MSRFVVKEIVDAATTFNGGLFPLKRANKLETEFTNMFSRHLGRLKSGLYFEGDLLLVTGRSGAGKTTEIRRLMREFNADEVRLPNDKPAHFAMCVLDRKGTWKDLGRNTLHSMGYPLADNARMTQAQIGRRIRQQGELQGVVGVWFDEAQHILAGKKPEALSEILDCFKTMVKGPDWPMMLVMSGVPELEDYIPQFEQLFRKVWHVKFTDIEFGKDADTMNEVVASYAVKAGIAVADELLSGEFLHRLVTAAGYRWGEAFELVKNAVSTALVEHAAELSIEHFISVWVSKTGMNPAATPFSHDSYETMFRRDALYQRAIRT